MSSLLNAVLLGMLAFGFLGFALPVYGKALGSTALEIGGLFSIFALMTLVLRPIIGWGIDRFGRKLFFVSGLVGYVLTLVLFAFADSIAGLYVARFMQGIASALFWIAAFTLATELNADRARGVAVGQVEQASARGQLFGALAGFFLFSQLPPELGWRVLFLAYAALAAVGAFIAWRGVPETRLLNQALAPVSNIISPLFIRLLVLVCLTALSTALIGPLLLIFLQDKFTTEISTLALAYIPAALVFSLLPARAGKLSDRYGRVPLMALGLFISGIVSLLFPVLPSVWFLVVLWAVEAVGLALALPAEEAYVADLTGNDVRGRGYGLYSAAASLGAIIGPLVGGYLYDQSGHAVPFLVNGFVLLLSALLVFVLLRSPMVRA